MAAPTKQASALSPTKQVSLVEDHGEQGIRPFRAVDDNGAAAALAVKREASNQKLEADRDAREMHKSDSAIKIAILHDPVKWRNPKFPKYPKPDVRSRLGATAMQVKDVSVPEVLGGRLAREGFAVLLLPGGFAPHFSDALGDAGEAIIQQFVSSGGGFVGICAGAYYGVWAGLLPAEIVDIGHWKRGSTDGCEIAWTADGASSVGAPARSFVRYCNGPILRGTGRAARSLCDFVTELRGAKGTFPPAMAGNSAILHGRYGAGRVVLISPHLESSVDAPTATLFCNLFRLAAAAPCQSPPGPTARRAAPARAVRPETDVGRPKAAAAAAGGKSSAGPAASVAAAAASATASEESSSEDEGEGEGEGSVNRVDQGAGVGSGASSGVPGGEGDEGGAVPGAEWAAALAAARPHAPVRLLPRAPPRAASREGGSRRPSVAEARAAGSRQVSAVTQKLRAARFAAASTPGGEMTGCAAPRAADDGYSSAAPYLCSLGAPLLFTAPHGLKLTKGVGPAQSARNHARERYTSEIVIRLAAAYAERQAATAAVPGPSTSTASAATAPAMASFMVWNYKTAAVGDPRNMDPNYLDRRTAANSPWHSCLHAWRAGFATAGASAGDAARPCPELMHFDVHGKNDREDTMAIDIGIEAMYADGCLEPAAVNRIRAFLGAELRAAFAGRKARSGKSGRLLPITVQERPQLHGYWGHGTVMTLSHQAALLGATSVQFELPCTVRSLLNEDAALFDAFAAAIFNTYDALAAAARAGELRPREGWARDEDGGLYLASLGTAARPLAELAVTPQLGAEGAAAMLGDLQRADAGRVHGKSI